MARPIVHLAVVLSLFLTSACASLSPEAKKRIADADASFERGEYAQALSGYQDSIEEVREVGDEDRGRVEIRIGRCQAAVGQPEKARDQIESTRKELDAGAFELTGDTQIAELLVAEAEVSLELGRQAEPIFGDSEGSSRKRATREAIDHYKVARDYYRESLDVAPEGSRVAFEASLGLGYAYLRKGILGGLGGDPDLTEAAKQLGRLQSRGKQFKDPRLPLYQACCIRARAGKLTREVYDGFVDAFELDPERELHELYREILLGVGSDYPLPEPVRAISDAEERRRIETLIAQLREYVGRGAAASAPPWIVSRQHVLTYVDGYDGWLHAEQRAIALIRSAEQRLLGDGYLELFRDAYAILEKVEPEFRRDRYDYHSLLRSVRTNYVAALQDLAEDLTVVGDWDGAARQLDTAQGLVDLREDPTTHREIAELKEEIGARREFSRWQDEIRALLVAGDQAAATDKLASLQKSRFFGTLTGADATFRERVTAELTALENEIDKVQAVGEVRTILDRIDAGLEAREVVTEGTRAIELARTNGLGYWQGMAARRVARARFDLGEYPEAMTALAQVARVEPADQVLKGLCYHRMQRLPEAAAEFKNVRPEVLLQASAGPEAVAAAGDALLQSGDVRRALDYLESVDDSAPEIRRLLLQAYRLRLDGLGETESPEPREVIQLCRRITELSPGEPEIRRRLAFLLYSSALPNRDLEAYRAAYEQLVAYRNIPEAPGLGEKMVAIQAELAACFADYVPLRPGRSWEYRGSDGQELSYEIVGERAGGLSLVDVNGSGAASEAWQVNREYRKFERREYPSDRLLEEFPVGSLPFSEGGREFTYQVDGDVYVARLDRVGQRVETASGTYENCIVIQTRSQGEAGYDEWYYAPDVGMVLWVNARTTPVQRYELLKVGNRAPS